MLSKPWQILFRLSQFQTSYYIFWTSRRIFLCLAGLHMLQISWNRIQKQPPYPTLKLSPWLVHISANSRPISFLSFYPERRPQEADVWSVSLFLMEINDLTKCFKFPLTQNLSAGDYNTSVKSSDPQRTARLLFLPQNDIHSYISKTFLFYSFRTSQPISFCKISWNPHIKIFNHSYSGCTALQPYFRTMRRNR